MPSIEATSITIDRIKLPEGKRGERKPPGYVLDTTGVYWNLWPDQAPQFVGMEGQTVVVNFKSEVYQGKPKHTILGIAGGNTGTPKAPPRVPAPGVVKFSAPTPPAAKTGFDPAKRDENIAILALVKLYEKQLQVGDRQALVTALRMCRSAWRELQTGNITVTEEELNDELPSFEGPKSIEETY